MAPSRSIREILDALDWARLQVMRRGSPDFIRQRQLEGRISDLLASLTRGPAAHLPSPKMPDFCAARSLQRPARHPTKKR